MEWRLNYLTNRSSSFRPFGPPPDAAKAAPLSSDVKLQEITPVRIALFKHSEKTFLQALDEAEIPYQEVRPELGQILACGAVVTIAQTAAVAGAIASVLVAWIRARASRKIILTLKDDTIVHLEGEPVDRVEELLPLVKRADVIDTESDES